MPIYRKSGGSWTTIRNIYRKSNGVWTSIENVYRKANGVWNSVFLRNNSPVIQNRVTISSNLSYIADGETATLTGRNYSWTPTSGLTLTYRFEKSTSITFATSTLVASGSIANPASGSSNTVTRSISPSDFSQTDMYFRFRVTAVNSSGTTVSLSDIVGVSYYGTPVPQSPYPEITGSTTVGNNAFGNIGVWTNSPTQYDYRWFFNSGLSSYPLTFSQSRSVTNKSLSGFTATLTTSDAHKYKVSDTAIITSVDSLLNKSLATITAVTNNTFSYTITTPTAWVDAGTAYSSGTYVSYLGNVYMASSTFSGVSAYSGGTFYNLGQIVYANNNRYQSKTNGNQGNSFTNTTHWTNLGSYAPGGSFWELQNFTNSAASGTTTAPNYYEGSVVSSTSILLVTPTTDYKTSIDLRGAVLGFGVKAYNPATSNPSEYTGNRFIYGIPVINLGAVTITDTSFSIAYTSSYMTKYIVDAKFGGTSVSGYPKTVTSPSSPIPVTGLSAGRNYDINVTPYNGENTAGTIKTKNETTTSIPTTPTISTVTSGFPGDSVSVSFSGGSGPFYQMYWINSPTAPTFGVTPDATGISSPLTDASGPSQSGTYYMYVRSTKVQDYTGIDSAQASPWSAGTQFIISNRPAIAFSYGAATSASGGWTASINSGTQTGAVYSLVSASPGSASVNASTGAISASGLGSGQSSTVVVKKTVTNYNDTTASATGSATTIQYSVSWSNPSGTTGSTTTGPFNAGAAHTAPSPGTRQGFTFSNWRYPATGDLIATLQPGGTYVPTSNGITFTAVWNAVPVPGSVSSITGSTGGRTGTTFWNDPKATMRYTFANTTSATARIQRSTDNVTWTSGATESLSISSNVATQSTNQPTGNTSASGNFYYRAQVISINGTTLGTPITSASFRNTVTPISNRAIYP